MKTRTIILTIIVVHGILLILFAGCRKKSDEPQSKRVPSSLTTDSIFNITSTSAACSSNVTDMGDSPITAKGVCWDTNHNPTIAGNHTNDGSGTGNFISTINGLSPSTLYNIRAYATNIYGTAYGAEKMLTTTNGLDIPTVSTLEPSNFKQTSADLGGNVTNDGGSAIVSRGVCFSTSPDPTLLSDKFEMGTGSGPFSATVTGLQTNTPYYVKAYAVNSTGVSFGEQMQFSTVGEGQGQPCPGVPTVIYRGRTYHTVQIGNQCWCRENLNVGQTIPGGELQDPADSIIQKYCYDNDTATAEIYGGMYQWDEAMQGSTVPGARGICPPGWHVPTDDEWLILAYYLGGINGAGTKMKAETTWDVEGGGTNSSGFTALAAGVCDVMGTNCHFNLINLNTYYWSSTQDNDISYYAWYTGLGYNYPNMNNFDLYKTSAISVRCIMDY
jgi:uncharacterized protein (TIGR02145 family)